VEFISSVKIATSLVFLIISVGLVVVAIRSAFNENNNINSRLAQATGENIVPDESANTHVLETLGNHLTLPGEDKIKRMRHQLAEAGYYASGSVKIFFASRLIVLLAPQLLILAAWGRLSEIMGVQYTLGFAALIAALSLYAPNFFIQRKKNKRILQARNGFPDMMDLLVASVEAGLGLDAALLRVTEEVGGRYPVLKTNLDLMNMELRAGADRQTAMATFANRLNLEEAKALSVIVRQSEEMGSSLGKALRTFSADMRMRRMMKAEEKAMALSAKLTVPLIVFIFPAIMVMLLLPSGVRIATGF